MNGMFCKPHMDSDKAEWVCKDIVGARLAKQKSGQVNHPKECGVSTLYERKRHLRISTQE